MGALRHRVTAVVLAAAAGAGLGSAFAADGRITFLKPRDLATILGPAEIELSLSLPAGRTAERVEILLDGRRIAVLDAAPWRAAWNAGDGTQGHRLEAVARLDDGSELRAAIRTSRLRVDQIERVDLVNLYLVVRDEQGGYVGGLTRDDFRVHEDRAPQTIDRFTASHKPLRVAIVLDVSGTMARGERLEKAQVAALRFLDVLEADDEGLVVTFSDSVQISQELTRDRKELEEAIRATKAGGGTALYDAVWSASRLLESFDGRRVLVLLSDGQDEALDGLGPGSLHTLAEAQEQALRSEVIVFAVGLGNRLETDHVRRFDPATGGSRADTDRTVLEMLRELADSTGGRAIAASSAARLGKAFDEIATDLRNQYSIAYTSTDPTRDGKWRTIDVSTPGRPGLEVVTRRGYYAPGGDGKNVRR
jgi:VWFA-related protein